MNNLTGKVNILLIAGICVILIIVGFFVYQTIINYQEILKETPPSESGQSSSEETATPTEKGTEGEVSQIIVSPALEKQNIVMVIAFKDFRDEEYFKPRQLFLAAGASVKTASTEKGTAIGADGGTVNVNLLVKEINPAEFDAIVFIGGPGALEYLDNEDSYKLARETISQGKGLAAICISPVILAKAGVLEGKKATVWTNQMDKSAIKILEDNGTIYQEEDVVTDGKIVTANGPEAADGFAMALIEALIQ